MEQNEIESTDLGSEPIDPDDVSYNLFTDKHYMFIGVTPTQRYPVIVFEKDYEQTLQTHSNYLKEGTITQLIIVASGSESQPLENFATECDPSQFKRVIVRLIGETKEQHQYFYIGLFYDNKVAEAARDKIFTLAGKTYKYTYNVDPSKFNFNDF